MTVSKDVIKNKEDISLWEVYRHLTRWDNAKLYSLLQDIKKELNDRSSFTKNVKARKVLSPRQDGDQSGWFQDWSDAQLKELRDAIQDLYVPPDMRTNDVATGTGSYTAGEEYNSDLDDTGTTPDSTQNNMGAGEEYTADNDSIEQAVFKLPLNDLPTADFTYSPSSPDEQESMTLDGSSSSDPEGDIQSYDWYITDPAGNTNSTLSGGSTHSFTPDNYGNWDMKLVVTDNDGATDSKTVTQYVNGLPTADFTYSPSAPDEWDSVSIDGSSSSDPENNISSYDWYITDPNGNTNSTLSGGSSHSFTPDNYGYWDIKLVVTDGNGATDSKTVTQYVNGIPTASFTYSPSSPDEWDTISVDGSGSSDPDGSISTYDWFITDPDGNVSSTYSGGSSHSFTPDDYGYWDIELTVEDDDGARDSVSTSVYVNSLPNASLSYSPSAPDENDSVTLDGSGSSDPDGSISTYDYYVTDPDGNTASATSAGSSTEYTVDDYGYWDFKLTVTDDDGATDSITHSQYVNGLPTADFSWTPSNPDEDDSVTLDGTLSSDPEDSTSDLSYDWTITDPFGNTGTATGSSYSFTPGEGGDWDVQLTVTDTDGATDSKTQIIDVNHNPVADFSYTPSQPAEGDSVSIDATNSSDVEDSTSDLTYDYHITDPDGNTSSTYSAGTSHSFTADDYGDWDIQVTVEDTDGGVDSKTVTQHVDAYPVSQFSGPDSVAVGNTGSYDGRESNGYSYDPDGSIDSYYWYMETTPDGAEYTIHSPNSGLTDITFDSSGEYVLVLEVTDNDGYTDTESLTIGVS